ncbi:cytochrome c biogenesis CcdA family protein [Cognatishimia activa]|uniref:Thiol:disulfide interchange protein n=1 Tax=Cognatishimia activa TaxID=1715691 RepID=A0A0P1ITT9_9RHOB|nr:cytochrome c biogenesis protein CcdA [Cognatishimia activa]CUI81302.1 thiol:disulfide interchange protein precursor [Cognatishimia activa]CUK26902.1 thiol:disulfide interchange protein precursor [Cognatishimia activa]
MDIGLFAAFGAGLLSFVSPCILPIVPFYLTYLAGRSVHQMAEQGSIPSRVRWHMILTSIVFSMGMITVFVLLGLVSTTLGQALRDYFDVLRWLAAAIVLAMGLQFLGVFKLNFLLKQTGVSVSTSNGSTLMGAFMLGLAFAFGWTPCVGPILAAILFMAAGQEQVFEGASLLISYGLGMTLPFIFAAAFIVPFLNWIGRFRSKLAHIERVMGVLLIVFALLIASDSISIFAYWILAQVPEFGKIG